MRNKKKEGIRVVERGEVVVVVVDRLAHDKSPSSVQTRSAPPQKGPHRDGEKPREERRGGGEMEE